MSISRIFAGPDYNSFIGYANNIYHLARMLLERGDELNLGGSFYDGGTAAPELGERDSPGDEL